MRYTDEETGNGAEEAAPAPDQTATFEEVDALAASQFTRRRLTADEREALLNAVSPRVEQAAQRAAALAHDAVLNAIEGGILEGLAYESPIEAVFAAWWLALSPARLPHDVELVPQREVAAGDSVYRVDFSIERSPHAGTVRALPDYQRIAIELDGHDFHERTKEQVTYRNRRDRDLQGAGWKVFHVSGSELWANPEHCVTGVMLLVARECLRAWTEYLSFVETHTAERAAEYQAGALTRQES